MGKGEVGVVARQGGKVKNGPKLNFPNPENFPVPNACLNPTNPGRPVTGQERKRAKAEITGRSPTPSLHLGGTRHNVYPVPGAKGKGEVDGGRQVVKPSPNHRGVPVPACPRSGGGGRQFTLSAGRSAML